MCYKRLSLVGSLLLYNIEEEVVYNIGEEIELNPGLWRSLYVIPFTYKKAQFVISENYQTLQLGICVVQ